MKNSPEISSNNIQPSDIKEKHLIIYINDQSYLNMESNAFYLDSETFFSLLEKQDIDGVTNIYLIYDCSQKRKTIKQQDISPIHYNAKTDRIHSNTIEESSDSSFTQEDTSRLFDPTKYVDNSVSKKVAGRLQEKTKQFAKIHNQEELKNFLRTFENENTNILVFQNSGTYLEHHFPHRKSDKIKVQYITQRNILVVHVNVACVEIGEEKHTHAVWNTEKLLTFFEENKKQINDNQFTDIYFSLSNDILINIKKKQIENWFKNNTAVRPKIRFYTEDAQHLIMDHIPSIEPPVQNIHVIDLTKSPHHDENSIQKTTPENFMIYRSYFKEYSCTHAVIPCPPDPKNLLEQTADHLLKKTENISIISTIENFGNGFIKSAKKKIQDVRDTITTENDRKIAGENQNLLKEADNSETASPTISTENPLLAQKEEPSKSSEPKNFFHLNHSSQTCLPIASIEQEENDLHKVTQTNIIMPEETNTTPSNPKPNDSENVEYQADKIPTDETPTDSIPSNLENSGEFSMLPLLLRKTKSCSNFSASPTNNTNEENSDNTKNISYMNDFSTENLENDLSGANQKNKTPTQPANNDSKNNPGHPDPTKLIESLFPNEEDGTHSLSTKVNSAQTFAEMLQGALQEAETSKEEQESSEIMSAVCRSTTLSREISQAVLKSGKTALAKKKTQKKISQSVR